MVKNEIWCAFYTRPRAEKKVNEILVEQGFETFLPLVKTLRIWSDRKKKVELPLIPSYIFVKTNIEDYHNILSNSNILTVVKIDNKPVPVPESDINNLRILINNGSKLKVSNTRFSKGETIELTHGQFKGFKGEILRTKGKHNLVIYLNTLKTSISLEISSDIVKKIKDK